MILVAIVFGAVLCVDYIVDWLWFNEMGYVNVFFTRLFTQLKFGLPLFFILLLLSEVYLRALKKNYFKKIASSEPTDMKALSSYTHYFAILFSIIVTLYATWRLWFNILLFVNATTFDVKDPIFKKDVSFYVFKLRFLQELNEMAIFLVVLFVIGTVSYYLLLLTMHTPDRFQQTSSQENPQYEYQPKNPVEYVFFNIAKVVNRQKPSVNKNNANQLLNMASTQITVLGVLFFLMVAGNFYLKQFELLHAHTGVVYGAGYADVNITLWLYRFLMVMALGGALSVGIFLKKGQLKRILLIPVLMIAVAVIGGGVSSLVQNFVVSPDEINKEASYLERNIKFTQKAYGLDDVSITPFAADNNLTAEDISSNSETISNIRINDYKPVNTFYNQTQSIRQYYAFNDVDIDRYKINGEITQTYMATREIDETKINDTWLNRHLKYTHGYGVTLSRVDKITASGQPDVLIKNIPPESAIPEIEIKRPEIYFGELSNEYILVNTDEDEFDYPDGNKNKYTKYEGSAGIKLNPINRVLFAIKEGSLKLLVSSNINNDSRIIINRNILQRVRKIMPYLTYESDPYAVTVDGKVYWMLDGYTRSSYYPYSEPYSGIVGDTNYIRNSVKVVVDAYSGEVNYYVVDETDPIAATYKKMFPKLFKDFSQMPEPIKEHMRYPNHLFEIQASIYTRYHMNDVKVFYQNEDLWDIAHEIYGTEEVKMDSTYFVVKLPGEEKAEFINSLPFTPKSKQNMTALMIARNDGENYGKLKLYQFPKNKTVYGPMQIEAQIDQNTKISQDFSLWSSSGSKYSRGNLFVVPVESSLLYVEPVYLEASNSAIPEVKRVIAFYDDKIAYEATLGECLAYLFGDEVGNEQQPSEETSTETGKPSTKDLIKKANDAYEAGQAALKNGDFAEYGRQMEDLEKYLNELAKN